MSQVQNDNLVDLILDSIADGVFTIDKDFHITSFNQAAEGITKFSREEAIGQYCCEIFRANVCFEQCALRETLETGVVHYFSRSRQKLWKKGESSGNTQQVEEIRIDCDQDAVVLRVKQKGPACHAGYRSCFYRTVEKDGTLRLNAERQRDPAEMYGSKK